MQLWSMNKISLPNFLRLSSLSLLLICWSCQPAAQEKAEVSEAPSEFSPASLKGNETSDRLKNQLLELRKVINPGSGKPLNRKWVVEFVQITRALAHAYPKDIEVPKYLSTAAEYARGINEVNEALSLYGQVYQNYPDHSLAPPALFIQGFILENELNQKDKAKVNYDLFIAKYPDHEFAETVSQSLKQLHMSPEQLIRNFEKEKNQ